MPQAGAKSTAASSLKFQAEATAHLQKSGVGRTQDSPKYQDKDVEVSSQADLASQTSTHLNIAPGLRCAISCEVLVVDMLYQGSFSSDAWQDKTCAAHA